VTSSLVSDKLR